MIKGKFDKAYSS
jgi:hypothetical protein